MKSAHFHAISVVQYKNCCVWELCFFFFWEAPILICNLRLLGNCWLILVICYRWFYEKKGGVSLEENSLGRMFFSQCEGLPDVCRCSGRWVSRQGPPVPHPQVSRNNCFCSNCCRMFSVFLEWLSWGKSKPCRTRISHLLLVRSWWLVGKYNTGEAAECFRSAGQCMRARHLHSCVGT